MKKSKFLIAAFWLAAGFNACSARKPQQQSYNFGLEQQDTLHKPLGWSFSFDSGNGGYLSRPDSTVAQEGKYSVFITKSDTAVKGTFGVCKYSFPARFEGKMIKLTGYLKMKDVKEGFAGLWMRVEDDAHNLIGFDNMESQDITGTRDWTRYSIEVPYNSKKATTIIVGALLTGSGQLWMDNLEVTIDGQPLAKVPERQVVLSKADKDALFSKGSGIRQIMLTPSKIKQYAALGELWGFIKYYHPAVARGDFNMDAELFRLIPLLDAAATEDQGFKVMETWVDHFGPVPDCADCGKPGAERIKLDADYADLFQQGFLPPSLQQKLTRIKNNYKTPEEHYYIELKSDVHNPAFTHEPTYGDTSYPDAGIRLLTLYRYWNMVQYFFPDRHLVSGGWEPVLADFIPDLIQAANDREYTLACLRLIARLGDTHANIWSNKTLEAIRGKYMSPFKAVFIEGKLVVTDYYSGDAEIRKQLKKGTVITKINDVDVAELIKRYLPLTPASNYETQLRDLPSVGGFMLRTDKEQMKITVEDGQNHSSVLECKTLPVEKADRGIDWAGNKVDKAYAKLDDNIGYIYPAKLKDTDIHAIRKALSGTKGIIVDLRCYPSSFMPFSYGTWFKEQESPFVQFSEGDLSKPGRFNYTAPISNGSAYAEHYKGQLVLLVNAITQSQAEYTVLALSTVKNAMVIGSTTAGADGNVSMITLPGNIHTMFSGIGIFYPDGGETQRVGVRIDKEIKPTINGIREGRDELLEAAKKIIADGK